MSVQSRLAVLFRNLTRKGDVERDLTDEVGSYVELAVQEKMEKGMTEADARRQVLLEFGGVEQVKEQVRQIRIGHFFDMRWQDLRSALRSLRKARVFSLAIVLVLGIGIGSTALIFAIVNSVLIKGPPYPEPAQLYMLWQDLPQEDHVSFSPHEFNAWKKQTEVFESLSAYTGKGFALSGIGEPAFYFGQLVTPSLFHTLRVNVALGRTFLESEGQDKVAILSHSLWRDKFDSQPNVLGKSIILNNEPHTIVGVAPEKFDFPYPEVNLWVPTAVDGPFFNEHPDAHFLRVIGRLKPGITPERLRAEIDLLGDRVDPADDGQRRHYYAVSLKKFATGQLRDPLLILLCAVAFLLLIACANVANLMLARAGSREPEMTIRSALGASRARLIAQLLTEACLLAALGGVLGLGMAIWGLDLLKFFGAAKISELAHAQIDWITGGFVFLITTLSGILFGVRPAFAASRARLESILRHGARSARRGDLTRQTLIFVEVGLAAVLLIGCGLMMRSFIRLTHVDPGFRPENVVVGETGLTKERYPDAESMIRFYRTALEKMRALPGVEHAGTVTHLPFGGNDWGNGFEIEGQPSPTDIEYTAQIRPISPAYFAALGVPLKSGRDFNETDNANGPGVAIVNEFLARRFWPNQSPIGQRIRYDKDWLSVVGVCGDLKHRQLDASSDAEIYVPYLQLPKDVMKFLGRDLNFVVRSSNPGRAARDLRTTIRALDPQMVVKIMSMQSLIDQSTVQPRFRTWLIGVFSILALGLACIGVYGVIAYLVAQRYKEIGIRIALGATRRNILSLILGGVFKLTAAGILTGWILAFFLSRFLGTILFGVSTHDPLTYLAVPACLILFALLAAYFPARRATRVDPVTSLRYD